MKWQPIETAPKDGKQILVCRWPLHGAQDLSLFCQAAAWWEDHPSADGDDGAWIVYCSISSEPYLHFEPTHWMPLPDPPEGA